MDQPFPDIDEDFDSKLALHTKRSICNVSPIPKGMTSKRDMMTSQEFLPTENLTRLLNDVHSPEDLLRQHEIERKIR